MSRVGWGARGYPLCVSTPHHHLEVGTTLCPAEEKAGLRELGKTGAGETGQAAVPPPPRPAPTAYPPRLPLSKAQTADISQIADVKIQARHQEPWGCVD